MAKRLPVPLQTTDVVGPHLPVPAVGKQYRRPPRVRKPSSSHDVIYAPTNDIDAHRAELRAAFGETPSDQFVETMMGKLISSLRPDPFDVLEEATLNAVIAVIASKATFELRRYWQRRPPNRLQRRNSQSILVKHAHIRPGAQGVVGIVNANKAEMGERLKN